jgi:hypothetical protein
MLDFPTTMTTATRRHVEDRFARATVETSPFHHIVIENFFPDDVYRKILDLNPFRQNAGRPWMEKHASANVTARTPYHARKQINFHENDSFDADGEGRRFWTELKDCFLGSTWFEALVMAKYPDYFRLRFGDMSGEDDFLSLFRKELFLQRHEPGYMIGPHTDIPTRVFTCIFAFADRPGFEEYGTQLLAPADRRAACWGNDHYPADGFRLRKMAPYSPNNFLLFFKSRLSFHAVTAITDEVPNQRYGMQFQFYEPSGGLLRDLSMPDLLSTKQNLVGETRLRRSLQRIVSRASGGRLAYVPRRQSARS